MRKPIQITLFFLLLCSFQVVAQNAFITGKITSSTGEVVPGVNVLLKGTNTGTITDSDGRYQLPAQEGILVFSFIGFTTMEIPVNGRTIIDVQMQEDVTLLEQVVVVGYGSQKKKDLTTAVVTVGESDIKDRPIVSAAEGLQGKAAGVQVIQTSGKPGADIAVRVRGSTSVLAGNEPLYVVDGVPTTDIRGLNPSDISTMSVLKDAASASIYGARAANGVVLITTKRGKANTPVISFSAYTGFSKLRKPIDVLNTSQYRALMDEILGPGTVDPAITTNTNWNKEVFGTGKIQSYQLAFSGGTDKSRYRISGNYLSNDGIVKPAKFDRYSLRLNLDNEVKSWLRFTTNVNVLSTTTKDTPDNLSSGRGGVIMSALNTPPFLTVYKNDGSGQFVPNPFQPSWENPIAYMYGPNQKAVDTRIFGNIAGEVDLVKGLKFKSNAGIDANVHQNDYYLDPNRTVYGRQQNGMGNADKKNSNTFLWENTLNYSRSIQKHNFSVLAGSSIQKNTTNESYLSGSDFPADASVQTLNAANIITGYTDVQQWSLESFFGRAMYDYDGKYLFTGSFRRDGSSKLANHWGTMPSFSAGWRVSSEPFMQNAKFIDDLKIRGGWGRNGNQEGIKNYARYGLIDYTRRLPTTPVLSGPAASQTTYGNPNLRWETTEQTNVGIDLSILESRVNFTFDAYLKKTSGVLLEVQLPSTLPITSIQTNGGSIENKGIEMNISTVNVDRALKWNTNFNISFNRNKVTKLSYTSVYYYGHTYSNNQDVAVVKEGLPLGSFFGYVADGVDTETGNMKFKDLNNDGTINAADRKVIGNGQPKFIYGMTNTLSYQNFALSIFLQGSQGNQIYNASRIDLEGMFDHKNQSVKVLNRWTPTNKNTDMPKAVGDGSTDNVRNSTRFVENGSYMRVKAITLSYNFKPELLKAIRINRLSVYATGQNLFTFTKYSGFDPEVNAFGTSATEVGIDYGTYPQSRTMTFGLNLEF